MRHVGGVHGPPGASEDEMTNHLVLTVRGLPTDANPEGTWYVDAGLGDALYEPLPLLAGAYDQGPFHLALEETPGGVGDWHLIHDPQGGFTGMAWRTAPTEIGAFAVRNEWLSTSPESGFVKFLTAQRRDATGVDVLRGQTLLRIGADAGNVDAGRPGRAGRGAARPVRLRRGRHRRRRARRTLETSARAHLAWEAAGRP